MLQTDVVLNQSGFPFSEYGCALMSCFFWASQITGEPMTRKNIILKTRELIDDGYINEKLYILDWGAVMVSLGVECTYLGHIPAEVETLPGEIEIVQVTLGHYNHFLPGDGKGHFVYDSMGVNSNQRRYKLKSKRIFRLGS